MMDCRVSVCIPTYNGGKYLQRQLETILSQLGEKDEVVISDDSSTDNTLEVIASFHDERIRLLAGNTFHSPIYNLENALKNAKGEYIFLSDQDDVWLDDKVKNLLPLLEKYDLAVSDCRVVDADEKVIHPSYFALMNSGKGFWKNLYKNTYIGCCMAFKREVLSYVLPFPASIPMHDSWIGLCAEYHGASVLFYDQPAILYRRHGSNASTASDVSRRPFFVKLKDRWNLLRSVLKYSENQCTK